MGNGLVNSDSAIVDDARFVADKSLRPRATKLDREATFPAENIADLHNVGLSGLLIPNKYGGLGVNLATYVEVIAELAKACGSTALVFAMHCGASRLLGSASTERAIEVLKDVVENGSVIAWGFSEPGIGGNVLAPQMNVTQVADAALHVRGTKAFCTGAGHVQYYLLNAASGEAEFRRSQTMLLINAAQEGLEVEQTWDAMGMRANQANNVRCDFETSVDNALGGIGAGMPLLAHAIPALVLGLAATSLGVAQAAHDFAIQHVTKREHVDKGHALSGYPTVRAQIAESAAALHGARLAILEAARLAETDPLEALPSMNLAKYMANSAAIEVADTSMELCGGRGFLRSAPMERFYRDSRAGAVMGTNLGALREMIGKFELGMDIRS